MTDSAEDDLRAALSWWKALLISDTEGQRAISRNVEPARLVRGIACLSAALPINRDDPEGWADAVFDRVGEITLVVETHQQRTTPTPNFDAAIAAELFTPAAPAAGTHDPSPQPKESPMPTLTKTPEQQRGGLATLRLDGSYVSNSRFKYSRELGGTGLPTFIANLRKAGIEPTDAAKFDALNAVELPKPAARKPGRALDMDPAAYAAEIEAHAAYEAAREAGRRYATGIRSGLARELQQSMTAEAEQYVDLLRPSFDWAIAGVRKVVDFGLGPQHGPEHAMECGPDAVEAWLAMTKPAGMASILDGIASLRIAACSALGIQPVHLDYSGSSDPIRYGPCFGVGDVFDKYNGWRRWVAIAATGSARLLSIAEIDVIMENRLRAAVRVTRPATDAPAEPVSVTSTPWAAF